MGLFSNTDEMANLRRRVSILERQLATVAQHVGIDQLPSDPGVMAASAEVLEHLRAGNRIAAIKAHREATGTGLAEAKRDVEEIERGLT